MFDCRGLAKTHRRASSLDNHMRIAYPITAGGRVFTFFVLMIGLGIVAVPAGLVASALSKAREEEAEQLNKSPQDP
jgi:hypothetical protein